MTSALSPAVSPLAAIPSPSQSAWYLGPLLIRAYALCIVLGIVVACAVTEVRMRRRGAPAWAVLDIAVWAVPFGIIGARVYHVLTDWEKYFGSDGNPAEALRIWHGGLGIWGAVAGGAVGAWIAARRLGIPLGFVADALAPGMPLAQAVGRWGNWFNNELYGKPTKLPWGLRVHEFDAEQGRAATNAVTGAPVVKAGLYHPTFLYESLWDLGVAVLVWALDRRYRFGRGRAFAVYVMAYTVGRFWVEALRVDEAHHILGMRLNNWTSIIVFIGALLYFILVRGPRQHVVMDEDGTLRMVDAAAADTAPTPAEAGADAGADAAVGDADAAAGGADTGDASAGAGIAEGGGKPSDADEAHSTTG